MILRLHSNGVCMHPEFDLTVMNIITEPLKQELLICSTNIFSN